MFSLRRWVRQIADEAATDKWEAVRQENAAEPVNIDSELDDGIILLYAREKGLLPPAEWKAKAVAWQVEFGTEGKGLWMSGYYYGDKPPSSDALAVAMRRSILEANVEIAEAEQKAATVALKTAKKANGGR